MEIGDREAERDGTNWKMALSTSINSKENK